MHNWENDLRSAKLPPELRYEKVKHKAKLLESKARNKEELKATANFNIEEQEKLEEEANDMYFEALQAKIRILNDMSKQKEAGV